MPAGVAPSLLDVALLRRVAKPTGRRLASPSHRGQHSELLGGMLWEACAVACCAGDAGWQPGSQGDAQKSCAGSSAVDTLPGSGGPAPSLQGCAAADAVPRHRRLHGRRQLAGGAALLLHLPSWLAAWVAWAGAQMCAPAACQQLHATWGRHSQLCPCPGVCGHRSRCPWRLAAAWAIASQAYVQTFGLAAAQALVDDWEFREEPFLEFVGPSLQHLAKQLQGCSDYDSQLKAGANLRCQQGLLLRPQGKSVQRLRACSQDSKAAALRGQLHQTLAVLLGDRRALTGSVAADLHVLTAIIERLGAEVQPFTGGFLQLLPEVWQQAERQPLVRMQACPHLQLQCHAACCSVPQPSGANRKLTAGAHGAADAHQRPLASTRCCATLCCCQSCSTAQPSRR